METRKNTLVLLRPDNKQPATVMRISSGRIALDTTCITPSVRWWTLGELEAINGRESVAAACKTPERTEHVIPDTDMPWEAYAPRKPLLVVKMPAELMASIRQAMYCQIKAA